MARAALDHSHLHICSTGQQSSRAFLPSNSRSFAVPPLVQLELNCRWLGLLLLMCSSLCRRCKHQSLQVSLLTGDLRGQLGVRITTPFAIYLSAPDRRFWKTTHLSGSKSEAGPLALCHGDCPPPQQLRPEGQGRTEAGAPDLCLEALRAPLVTRTWHKIGNE